MKWQNQNTKSSTEWNLPLASLLAALAGLLGATGDVLLFYAPGFSNDLFAVRQLADWRIVTGTLVAITVIPFLALGYWALSKHFTRASNALADCIFFGGIFGVSLGTAIHGTVGTLVQMVQSYGITAEDSGFIATFAPTVLPLYGLFYLLMAVGTILLAALIWQGKSRLPRWFILLLPLWLNVLVLPLGRLLPPLGDLLFPSIANLSHALMFAVLAWWSWKHRAG